MKNILLVSLSLLFTLNCLAALYDVECTISHNGVAIGAPISMRDQRNIALHVPSFPVEFNSLEDQGRRLLLAELRGTLGPDFLDFYFLPGTPASKQGHRLPMPMSVRQSYILTLDANHPDDGATRDEIERHNFATLFNGAGLFPISIRVTASYSLSWEPGQIAQQEGWTPQSFNLHAAEKARVRNLSFDNKGQDYPLSRDGSLSANCVPVRRSREN